MNNERRVIVDGPRIRVLREDRNLTQMAILTAFAEAGLYMSQSYLSRMERGVNLRFCRLTTKEAQVLANLLGVQRKEFTVRTEQKRLFQDARTGRHQPAVPQGETVA